MTTDRQKILMCPPDYFSVDYVINPWMAGNEGQLDLGLARTEWQTLHDSLAQVADIELFDPQPDLPDLVFTANAGFVGGAAVVPSHFMPHERRPEEPYLKQWFADHGFDLRVLPEDIGFEGAGDCLIDRAGPWLWTGYGFRTEIEAHAYLSRWFDREVVSIRLTDARFYHIDTCLCPLAGGYLLYFPDAFDADSIQAIEKRVPVDRRICVGAEDAANFACNAVNVGRHIFSHGFSGALQKRLGELGFELHTVPLSEFLKAGGSAKCLTLKLTERDVSPEGVGP
jgi:N-dimethylarginine dimethylaminohydrolase